MRIDSLAGRRYRWPMRLSPKAKKAFQEFGRIGGKKGGKATAARRTAAERSEAARKAVRARWAKAKKS